MFFFDLEGVKHLLNVGYYWDRDLVEMYENSKEAVCSNRLCAFLELLHDS